MYRIMIIDDEPLSIRNLKQMIESADHDFCVIDSANEGATGLKKIQENEPDLVFLDISMPVMDGLETLEKLRISGNKIPVVIISGYQEFQYAKRAITFGVVEYLVKPLNPLNLTEVLAQIKSKLEQDHTEQILSYFQKLFHSGMAADSLGLSPFDEKKEFLLAKICLNAFNFFRSNQFAMPVPHEEIEYFRQLCGDIFKGHTNCWIIEGKYSNEFLLITDCKERVFRQNIMRLYDAFLEKVSPQFTIDCVISLESKRIDALRDKVTRLESILYHNKVFAKSGFFLESDFEIRKMQLADDLDYDYIAALAKRKKKDALEKYLQDILNQCEEYDCTQAELIQILRNSLRKCCVEESEYEIDFMINLLLINANNYQSLLDKYNEIVQEYSDGEKEEGSTEYTIEGIKEYLDRNYQEKILIQDVADKFGYNYSYLCNQFKRVVKVSPNEYLIMKRMEYSKNLLINDPQLNVKNIAELAGYTDQYYFSRIFKLYEGMTPSEYRKKHI